MTSQSQKHQLPQERPAGTWQWWTARLWLLLRLVAEAIGDGCVLGTALCRWALAGWRGAADPIRDPHDLPLSLDALFDERDERVLERWFDLRVKKVERYVPGRCDDGDDDAVGELHPHAFGSSRALAVLTFADSRRVRVFVKLHSHIRTTNALLSSVGLYHNEVNAYRQDDDDRDGEVVPLKLRARCFAARVSSTRLLLVLEDLAARPGTRMLELVDPELDQRDVEAVLDTLAQLHAHSIQHRTHESPRVWNARTRPNMGGLVGLAALYLARRRWPQFISESTYGTLFTVLECWQELLRRWDADAFEHVVVHGDAHAGNMFITYSDSEENGDRERMAGLLDLQCVQMQHPMRDVAYFIALSLPPHLAATYEKDWLRFYLNRLSIHTSIPSLPSYWDWDACRLQYRLHTIYALYATLYSSAFSHLMDDTLTAALLPRVIAQCERLDLLQALQTYGLNPQLPLKHGDREA
jgi:hypothetical protein